MKDLKIFTNNVEEKAINQINDLLDQEAFKDCKIRIMPDVHAGKGCVIGFTGNLGKKVIPNIVGVDIGCGLLCVNLGKINIDYEKLDSFINSDIPSGRRVNQTKQVEFDLSKLHCRNKLKDISWIENSIGSLGGGNHFIEIDEASDSTKYLVIHTGSRNLGKQVAEYYQDLAIHMNDVDIIEYNRKKNEVIKTYTRLGNFLEIQKELQKLKEQFSKKYTPVPTDLAYLENNYRNDYLDDMKICQEFAITNRFTIASRIIEYMNWTIQDSFESIHNYISFDDNIVRKGAISAKKKQKLIIPINMRDGCILGTGKGNDDWNNSAPHGAGRIMSRMEAMKSISLDEYKESMKGIYTSSVNESTKDEAPFVYKPMDEIIENIKPSVDVDNIIKPVYNFKAAEDSYR